MTESGAAEYRVPLRVPPGIAGMEPKLALVYNSQAGNGLLGVGWSLEGLSSITRCARTMAQDGVRGGVNYDANDRFCLDGQRLMAISGTYGAEGTEYRTERESFSRVISFGQAGSGPAWFKVWTKGGQILEYGNTADSRVEAQGKASVRVWALSKASDTRGNAFAVSYVEDNANGDYYPARFDYAPAMSVRMVYEGRADVPPAYLAGSLASRPKRLSRIETHAGESLARQYQLTYAQGAGTKRSRLAQLVECAGSACLPPVTLLSNDASPSFSDSSLGAWGGAFQAPQVFAGDYNGDGLQDVLYLLTQADGHFNWRLRLSSGSGLGDIDLGLWGGSWQSPQIFVGDFNGDGLQDILYLLAYNGSYNWRLRLSSGTSFGDIDLGYWGGPFQSPQILVGDYNGDGMQDVLYLLQREDGHYNWRLRLSSGSAFGDLDLGFWGASWQYPRIMAGDFNGDGMQDVLYLLQREDGHYNWRLRLSSGSAFGDLDFGFWGASWQNPHLMVGDYNGDGLQDVLYLLQREDGHYNWRLRLSSGSGFGDLDLGFWGATWQYPHIMGGDYNGDGLQDVLYLLRREDGHYNWRLRLSSGSGFGDLDLGFWGGSFQSPRVLVGDYDGDGKSDVLYLLDQSSSFDWRLRLSQPALAPFDLVTSVASGEGTAQTISYRPLTDGAVYVKDPAPGYPRVSLRVPLYVVSLQQASNGIGGDLATTYAYGGLQAEPGSGRGSLGLRWQEATSQASGIKVRSEFRQDWPYVGLPALTTTSRGSGAVLKQATHTYGCVDAQTGGACTVAAGSRYFPFLSQSVETGHELNGVALPSTTTSLQYDAFGNPTRIAVSTPDGHSKTTTNIFANDSASWLLGRLTRSTVQSTGP